MYEAGLIAAEKDQIPLIPQREAYRRYALTVVHDLMSGRMIVGDLAAVLTGRAIPTPNGHTNWRPNQVTRLLHTGKQHPAVHWILSKLTQFQAEAEDRFTDLDNFEEEEDASTAEEGV